MSYIWLVEEQDSLFSPFDRATRRLNWMAKYKAFLKKEQRPFFTKKFFFEASEAISKDFFRNYFEEQWSVPIFNNAYKKFLVLMKLSKISVPLFMN